MKNTLRLLKALSDETRIAILKNLINEKELSCSEMSKRFSLSQPTLSHHFNKLVAVGVLQERKEGSWRYYSLDKKNLKDIGINIKKLFGKEV